MLSFISKITWGFKINPSEKMENLSRITYHLVYGMGHFHGRPNMAMQDHPFSLTHKSISLQPYKAQQQNYGKNLNNRSNYY